MLPHLSYYKHYQGTLRASPPPPPGASTLQPSRTPPPRPQHLAGRHGAAYGGVGATRGSCDRAAAGGQQRAWLQAAGDGQRPRAMRPGG